jgi:hypothetical protein
VLLFGMAIARAGDLFPVRDENPLLRGFYLPLPSEARAGDATLLAATLSVSNTINVEARDAESLFVDGESSTLRLNVDGPLATDWRYRVTVPFIHDGGGILDTTIDSYHQLFGLPRGPRPSYPKNQLRYFYTGVGHVALDRPQSSIGDIAAEVGWYGMDTPGRSLSLWGGVEAPTGSAGKLTGDGAWDGAVWAHVAARSARWQFAGEAGVAEAFGDAVFAGAARRATAFARAAATRMLDAAWSLRVQLDGESRRVTGSELRFLGPSLQMTAGAVYRWLGRWRAEFGFSEDIAVNTAPDITFFIGIHD